MKNQQYLFFFILLLLLSHCQSGEQEVPKSYELQFGTLDTFPVASSIRAIQAISDQEVWFAGSNGLIGHSSNAGLEWTVDTIPGDSVAPHFRSLAVHSQATHALSIGSPALLYRKEKMGNNWLLVYQEDHPKAFYDAMAFWDDQYGIAMGDPTDGCLSVIRTEDGGVSWQKVPCTQIPDAVEGEAAFAASNTNLALGENGRVWMVSGGQRARVYVSEDYGKNWEVFDSPIKEGGQMTGIYTVAFADANKGIIFGGDWNEKEANTQNKAISNDGGRTWSLIADGTGPGYRSCVQFFPASRGLGVLAVGSPGINYSPDSGTKWETISTEGFYTADIGENTIWVAGNQRIGRFQFELKKE